MKLYLIRHGETDHNVSRVMQGHEEVPLNDRGIAQAAALGRRLSEMPVDHIYASDLRRAAMTAAIVGAHTRAPIEYLPGLRERHPGDLTGLPYDHGESPRFFTDPEYQPPNGEHADVFARRVAEVFGEISKREAGRERAVAAVTHGMVCAAFLRVCVGQSVEEIAATRWPNASLTVANYNGIWSLEVLGDDSHLDEPAHPGAQVTGA